MSPTILKYKAAVVNAEPGWLDLELSVKKTIHCINKACRDGCKLIAFLELRASSKIQCNGRLQLTCINHNLRANIAIPFRLKATIQDPREVSNFLSARAAGIGLSQRPSNAKAYGGWKLLS